MENNLKKGLLLKLKSSLFNALVKATKFLGCYFHPSFFCGKNPTIDSIVLGKNLSNLLLGGNDEEWSQKVAMEFSPHIFHK